MKKLTQAVFDGMPKWVKSARIDAKGKLVVYSLEKSLVTRILNNEILLPWNCGIWDSGFDTTDWQNSAIDRGAESNTDKLNQLISDINNNIDLLVDAFSKDTGISSSDVYVEVSVECYDKSID